MTVKATRADNMGAKAVSGYIVDGIVPFVALPSHNALHKFVRVTNTKNGESAIGIVLDVGPWFDADDDYVFRDARPRAESGRSATGQKTDKSGMVLGDRVCQLLGILNGSAEVDWEFFI